MQQRLSGLVTIAKLLYELVGDVRLAEEAEPREEREVELQANGACRRGEAYSICRLKKLDVSGAKRHKPMNGLVVYGGRCSQCENAADYGCRLDVFGGGDSCASGLL